VITTGSNNVVIGSGSDPSAADGSNQIVVGYGATGQANNSVTLGNADVTAVYMAQDAGATIHAAGITSATDGTITIDPNGSGTLALGSADNTQVTVDAIRFSIDATGGASNIWLAADGADDDLTVAVTGVQDASLVLTSAGTGADAVQLTASAGGIDISASGAAADEDIDIVATSSVNITSTEDVASAVYVRANGGTSETVKIHSDQGTSVTEGAESVTILSDAGGVGIRSTANLANAVNLTVDGGTTSTMTLFNDQGTSVTEGAASVQLLSDAGGIGIKSTANLASSILLTADGGTTETIKVHADQGTSATSIELVSDAGGVTISAASSGQTDGSGGAVDFNGSEIEDFKASIYTDANAHTLTASENGKIIIFTSGSDVALTVPTGLAIGFNCLIVQTGSGAITLTQSSTNIYNRNSHTKTAGQYAVMSLFSYDTNKFISSGDGTS